eukprot:7004616-Karenia_brevis.AAC.1
MKLHNLRASNDKSGLAGNLISMLVVDGLCPFVGVILEVPWTSVPHKRWPKDPRQHKVGMACQAMECQDLQKQ